MYATRVQSLDHVPTSSSSRVTGCEKTCLTLSTCQLQIFNLVDFCVGMMLGIFGFYLYNKLGAESFTDVRIAWLEYLCLSLGILLLTSSFLSFCAITNTSCRWAVIPSSYIGIIIAMLSLLLGSLVFAFKSKTHTYLVEHGSNIGLSENEVSDVEKWYDIIGYCLFSLCVVEFLRYRVSRGYREVALRADGEFDALLAEEDKHYQDRFLHNKSAREDKYDNLRSYYRSKYAAGGSGASSSVESQF